MKIVILRANQQPKKKRMKNHKNYINVTLLPN